jgi:hypothetical protein
MAKQAETAVTTNGNAPKTEPATIPLLSEVLVTNPKFTLNIQSDGKLSLTIRTDNEEELGDLLRRWEPHIIVYPDANGSSNGKPRYFAGDSCPDCSNKLVRRQGKRGKFLGCLSYPDCDFTQPL